MQMQAKFSVCNYFPQFSKKIIPQYIQIFLLVICQFWIHQLLIFHEHFCPKNILWTHRMQFCHQQSNFFSSLLTQSIFQLFVTFSLEQVLASVRWYLKWLHLCSCFRNRRTSNGNYPGLKPIIVRLFRSLQCFYQILRGIVFLPQRFLFQPFWIFFGSRFFKMSILLCILEYYAFSFTFLQKICRPKVDSI